MPSGDGTDLIFQRASQFGASELESWYETEQDSGEERDTKSEEAAEEQLDKALAADTNNPAIYNNLANIYGHHGPVKKAFEYYAKALQLNPLEPVYYHNLGTTVVRDYHA